jgi:homoserine kinase
LEQIPRSRGLGSSASIRLGILLALNRLSRNPLDRFDIFKLCAELEGHPDNAAPATFGGFNVVQSRLARRDTGTRVQHFAVSPRLFFVLLVPELEIQTSRARNILPSKISYAGAVDNLANACTLTAAFAAQDYKKLSGVFADHLHQPFRVKLIPFLPRVIGAAEKAGALGAFLSGSGSTICALTLQHLDRIGTAMKRETGSIPSRIIKTRADNRGARLLRSR